jgi:hypothetical protein
MNAQREPIAVFRTVQTLKVHTCAIVAVAIILAVMDTLALVWQLQYNNYFGDLLNTIISDTNECEENIDGCSQNCRNMPGSFRCGCDPGYQLGNDSRTCQGYRIKLGDTITIFMDKFCFFN